MEYLTLGLLLAIGGIGGFLLLTRKRVTVSIDPHTVIGHRPRSGMHERQQGKLDLDQQTRFIETPKRKQYRLLNDSERELYHRLGEAMPNMRVFAQVGVSQLALARGRQEAQRLSRMAGRGVDFVVCDPDFAIVAAIELSWPTSGEEGSAAEEEKRQALQSLGIPLIVFHPNKLPDADVISREIADAIVRRNRLEVERA